MTGQKQTKYVLIILAIVGGTVFLGCAGCAGLLFWVAQPPQASAQAREPFHPEAVPVPTMLPRGTSEQWAEGVECYEIALGPGGGFYDPPGHGGSLWLYLPSGEHEPKSLPCVLIAGAGSPMFCGMPLGDGDRPEHIPYVEAGFAVIAYEMDGPWGDEDSDDQMGRAYEAFRDAQAGVVNARNALEYALRHVPEIDPNRIFAAGHSSAGSAALLFAAHEPRLAGVVAYAPCYDVTKHLGGMLRILAIQCDGIADFAVQSSPKTHEARIQCPVFLFHASGDQVCDIEDSQAAEARMQALGIDVTLATTAGGDHYNPMINDGIFRAIEWMQQH